MKYRTIFAAAALAGLMSITACSTGALSENNEGNYNGERLVDSVTRTTRGQTNRNITENNRGLNHHRYDGATRTQTTYERNTRGLNGAVNHTFDYKNDLNRGYVNDRAHRLNAGELALNNDRFDDCRTVPCAAIDNDETASRVSEFMNTRRNRNAEPQPITPEVPVQPGTLPAPAPETDNNETDNGENEVNTTPEPTPVPAGKGATVERIMK